MEERESGMWSRWTMLNVGSMSCSPGMVYKPASVGEHPTVVVGVPDGTSYEIRIPGLEWNACDMVTVTRVIDGEGDLYLRFVRRKPA